VFRPVAAEAAPKATPQDAPADAPVADLRAQIADMRSQRDAWQGIAERLALGAPKNHRCQNTPVSWWRWLLIDLASPAGVALMPCRLLFLLILVIKRPRPTEFLGAGTAKERRIITCVHPM
jgi:hypothetical protein